jgi:FKBP-type peptidyl-prolyl cis-trans isomerase
MKKSCMILAIAAMLTFAASACSQEKVPYEGYQKTTSGLYYRFYTQNEGELPQLKDAMEVVIGCVVNDTNFVFPVMNNVFQCMEPLFPGDIFEGMAMMHKGDSASFIVNIDSTFKTLFGQSPMPSQYTSTDVMRFEVKMKDFYPVKEFYKRTADQRYAETMRGVEQVKANYPEEDLKAAEELAAFLKNNNIEAEPTESGLYYVMTQEGTGEKPEAGQLVKVHYTGKLLSGEVFDSSIDRGVPFQFPLGIGQVIPGWNEGIGLMSKGEKGVLYIPYYLGYGVSGSSPVIPPFANLVFEVELVDFEDMPQ